MSCIAQAAHSMQHTYRVMCSHIAVLYHIPQSSRVHSRANRGDEGSRSLLELHRTGHGSCGTQRTKLRPTHPVANNHLTFSHCRNLIALCARNDNRFFCIFTERSGRWPRTNNIFDPVCTEFIQGGNRRIRRALARLLLYQPPSGQQPWKGVSDRFVKYTLK